MALVAYGFKCVNPECDRYQVEYEEILERDAVHKSKCQSCHRKAQRVFSLGGFAMDFTPGFDFGLGRYIETKRQRENILAEKNIRKLGC